MSLKMFQLQMSEFILENHRLFELHIVEDDKYIRGRSK